MKKITVVLFLLLACCFHVNAQQYVSTEPANRNVIIEEFTGRDCGYCPGGHVVANEIVAANPNRAWAINVHAGFYSPTTYPNFQCPDGIAIHNGFNIQGYPSGAVNRQGTATLSRGQWPSAANAQLGQASELNIGGQAVVDIASRIATITVEVYYTGNSTETTNYLTVAMLQDSIWGSQSGGSSNPEQYVNGQYCHMHILRDVVNSSDAWGDAITPTTQGTLITKSYTYEIPESIGNPNGVDVDLDNIHFLAWVTKDHYYVLSANELNTIQGSDQPINPVIKSVAQEDVISCEHSKNFTLNILNGGTEALTALAIETTIDGETFTEEWTGNIASYQSSNIDMTADVPFGTHNVDFKITSANGAPFEYIKNATVSCPEWNVAHIEGEEETLTVNVWQDRFGNQITWELLASDYTVLGSGGPYTMYFQDTSLLHSHQVVVPADECIKFVIRDDVGNGICCQYGDGHYNVVDSQDNILVEGDGEFTNEMSSIISIVSESSVSVTTLKVDDVSYNHAVFTGSISAGQPETVGFEYKKVTSSTVSTVEATLENGTFTAEVSNLDPSTIYMVHAFAIVNGVTYLGEDLTFSTWTEGVAELESSLRIYPNPAADVLNIEGNGMVKVEVFNTVGQLVMSQSVEGGSASINTANLNNGIYFTRIYNENGEMISRRFSVSH
jgi:hypothetical protein